MADYAGGYTSGLGDVVWDEPEIERWHAGWCAVGVYCDRSVDERTGSAKRRSLGLYDPVEDVVFVRNVGAPASLRTVAHETVHALQHQNFLAAWIPHPWDNRDVDSAVSAAIEGDAHLIGWRFGASERVLLCRMDPRSASHAEAQRWQWRPQAYTAHEDFGHVFGPGLVLGHWLEGGVAGVNDLLRNPPLSSRDVLKDGRPRPVDFIALAEDAVGAELTERGCEVGLTNTVGALGIWGLLVLHDNASDETAPGLVDQWLGDRFLHVACPGQRDDELAWVTRWRSEEAAHDFNGRYGAMAASVLAHGGVLAATPSAFQRGRVVVVVTPGLQSALDDLLATEFRTFTDFANWVASGCFPNGGCESSALTVPATGPFQGTCAQESDKERQFARWLQRARQDWRSQPAANEWNSIREALAALPRLCPDQRAGQEDLAQACLAAYSGVHTWLGHQCNWDGPAAAVASAQEPTAGRDLWEQFSDLYGTRLAERGAAASGTAGLLALTTSPPLSTLAILQQQDVPVDFVALPPARLATVGCEVLSSHVQGVLGTWTYLTQSARLADATTPPAWLLDWRGDRFTHLRCGERRGTVWATRWASEDSAHGFVELAPLAGHSDVFAYATAGGTHTAWSVSPELAPTREAIRQVAEIRTYSTFSAWREDGCFPGPVCR